MLFGCFAVLGNFITLTLVYSACVNQFTSTTVTVASNNQQPPAQSSVLAEQNDTLAHSTPAVTEIATSPENVSIINPVATTSVCTPGSSTCRARNSKMNGKHSIRITTFERKQLKLQNSLRKKAGNFDYGKTMVQAPPRICFKTTWKYQPIRMDHQIHIILKGIKDLNIPKVEKEK